jgi:hypothetical protein
VSKTEAAYDSFYDEYHPDWAFGPGFLFPVWALDEIGVEWIKWPGKHMDDLDASYQMTDEERMTQDELSEFAQDPTHFMLTKYLPRNYAALKPFEKFNFQFPVMARGAFCLSPFSDTEMLECFAKIRKCNEGLAEWGKFVGYYNGKLVAKGYPVGSGCIGDTPFDMIGDTMRGMTNILIDMLECPDELAAALETAKRICVRSTLHRARLMGVKYVWFMLHNGFDSFMGNEDFGKFYWPGLKAQIDSLVENGLTPVIFCQGLYNNRMEFLKDVPKGKVVYSFESSDIVKAKRALGGTACVMGNIPAAALVTGTPGDMADGCKRMLDACAPGGGFIMDFSCGIDVAKPENLHAFFDVCETYGKY